MRKIIALVFLLVISVPNIMKADDFKTLWAQYGKAESSDLPQTKLGILGKIIDKAKSQRSYGNLLKAQALRVGTLTSIAPDSLQQVIASLETETRQAEKKDKVLASVYHTVLGAYYNSMSYSSMNSIDNEKYRSLCREHYSQAMKYAELLAQTRTSDYLPAVVEGRDSHYFGSDMLHVVGYQVSDFATMHNYYRNTQLREAAMFTALDLARSRLKDTEVNLKDSRYVATLDSLMAVYGDIDAACEIAIARYEFMSNARDVRDGERYSYLKENIAKWKNWENCNSLRNSLQQLTNPQFNIGFGSEQILPDEERKVAIDAVRNLDNIKITLTRIDADGNNDWNLNDKHQLAKVKQLQQLSTRKEIIKTFGKHAEYDVFEDSVTLPKLPLGVYLVEIAAPTSNIKPQYNLLYVSNVFVIGEKLPGDKLRYVVVNATDGQPISGAKLKLSVANVWNKPKIKIDAVTDKNGEYILSADKEIEYDVWAYTEEDRYMPNSDMYSYFGNSEVTKTRTQGYLYTDRRIYRPGQTVHAALVVFTCTPKNETSSVANKKYKLTLYDANHQEVETLSVVTDDFGKASADFKLPENQLTGNYTIVGNGISATSFSVEEYKRPTFTVEFPDVTDNYSPGDTLSVAGYAKSYAGVPVQGAKVKYHVRRQKAMWWRWWFDEDESNDNLLQEEAVTDSDGKFIVKMPMILPEGENEASMGRRYPRFYNIIADAEVTDMSGESHSAFVQLPLGTKPTAFSVDLAEKMLRDSVQSVKFNYTNMAGKPIAAEVKVSIDGQLIGNFKANENVSISRFSTLNSGRHILEAICENDSIEREFIIFTLKDKRPVVETHDWFYLSATEFPKDGKPIHLQLGTSDENTHVVYNIFTGKQVLEQSSLELSNSLHNRQFKYDSKYGDAVYISYAWVKNAKLYKHSALLRKPLPDKRLKAKWTTFRNRLTPGQSEEWTLNITHPDGKPADAQLMAVLYDKSLDQIRKHNWDFNLNLNQVYLNSDWRTPQIDNVLGWFNKNIDWLELYPIELSKFDESLFEIYSPYSMHYRGFGRPMMKMNTVAMAVDASSPIAKMELKESMDYASVNEEVVVVAGTVAEEEPIEKIDDVQIRENLEETAFFYPALRTDDKGNVSISFTLPESLTTWRFMGIAHDRSMNYSQTDAEVVAKKDVMVQPNMPRFIRLGDKAVIAAKIINTSDKQQNGSAILQLLNPETEEVVYQKQQAFTVEENETTNVSFDFSPSDENTLLYICKIVAKGENFSDGEQHYLPILTNKELVTNTRPFTQNSAGTFTLDLNTLFDKDVTNERLTIEYAQNPAWMMVQAMPTYSAADRDDAITQAVSLYVNSIGQYIMNQSPIISQTIQQWRNDDDTSMLSELEKNQELKTLMLNQTTWVSDANNEASQRRSLVKFFDNETMKMRKNSALEKLRQLQNSDGSWSWWQGMRGSIYMTTAISEMFVRMNKLIGEQSEIAEMQAKAFSFLDNYIVEEYDRQLKQKSVKMKDVYPSETTLHILYINSLANRRPKGRGATVFDFFVKQLSLKPSVLSIYGKACSALILARNGYEGKAAEYMKSMEEYSVMTEEMGRYFDTHRALYSWFDYKIPTQVAAIEALKELKPDDKITIEEMQRWLLQEKRTTSWDTPINAVEAIYAFLDGNMKKLEGGEPTVIRIDGNVIDMPKATAGMGYQKISVDRNDRQMLTAEKTSEGTSWGAIYAQFTQKVSDVKPLSSGISIKREILNGNQQFKVGDKVKVRLTIKAERDYDFVEVVDKRAACLEPVDGLSGYRYGYYIAPRDFETSFYFDIMPKGTHVVEAEYYIDREGEYETGTATVQCAYSPAFKGRDKALKIGVDK